MKIKGPLLNLLQKVISKVDELKKIFTQLNQEEMMQSKEAEELHSTFESGPFQSYLDQSDTIINQENKEIKKITAEKGWIDRIKSNSLINIKKRSVAKLKEIIKEDMDISREIMKTCQNILSSTQDVLKSLNLISRNLTNTSVYLRRPNTDFKLVSSTISTIDNNINGYETNLGALNEILKSTAENAKEIKDSIENAERLVKVNDSYSRRLSSFVERIAA
ncbi:hypothetical protein ACFL96_09315 [Thermoproteota archaeon]